MATVREQVRAPGTIAWAGAAAARDVTASWAGTVLATVAVAATVAAAIHAAVTPEHVMEATQGNVGGWLPLAFAVGAGAGLIYAASLLLVTVSRAWLVAGIILHLPMVGLGFWSRTLGLPGSEVEGPSVVWGLATFAELTVIVLAVALLVWSPGPIRLNRRQVLVAAILGVAAFAAAFLFTPEAIDHAQMLAGWMWRAPRAVAGWMWRPRVLAGWMWLVRWG